MSNWGCPPSPYRDDIVYGRSQRLLQAGLEVKTKELCTIKWRCNKLFHVAYWVLDWIHTLTKKLRHNHGKESACPDDLRCLVTYPLGQGHSILYWSLGGIFLYRIYPFWPKKSIYWWQFLRFCFKYISEPKTVRNC